MDASNKDALLNVLMRAGAPLTGTVLASQLGVTPRTVRNWIRNLRREGTPVRSSRLGYSLGRQRTDDGDHREGRAEDSETPEKRLSRICGILASTDAEVDVYALAATLSVSESTLETYFNRIRKLIRQYDLQLERSGHLVRLVGTEGARRRLLRQFLYGPSYELGPGTWKTLVEKFEDLDLPRLREALESTFKKHGVEFTEYALISVMLHVTVALDRTLQGHALDDSDPAAEGPEPRDSWEAWVDNVADAVTGDVARAAHELTGVELPPAELGALRDLLLIRGAVPLGRNNEAVVDPEITAVVTEIVTSIADGYHLAVSSGPGNQSLALHVQGLLRRSKTDSPLPRPLGPEFRTAHPLLYNFALEFASNLKQRFGVDLADSPELDYLALHLGVNLGSSLEERDHVPITVVTPRYHQSAELLRKQVSAAVKGVGFVEQVLQRMDVDFSKISSDLIVSTVAPTNAASVPVVVIDPIPSRQQLDTVSQVARAERDKAIRRRIRTALSTLLDPRLFVREPGPLTRSGAIRILADKLQEMGYTGPGFSLDVLDRERWSSTAFGADFAIPHSMKMDARGTAIAVMVCPGGVQWGNDTVRLILMFALNKDGRVIFRDVLDEITRMLAQGYPVAELIEAGQDADQFIDTFTRLLDRESGF